MSIPGVCLMDLLGIGSVDLVIAEPHSPVDSGIHILVWSASWDRLAEDYIGCYPCRTRWLQSILHACTRNQSFLVLRMLLNTSHIHHSFDHPSYPDNHLCRLYVL